MNPEQIKRLRAERNEAAQRMAALIARTEERNADGTSGLTAEDRASFDAASNEYDRLTGDITRAERAASVAAAQSAAQVTIPGTVAQVVGSSNETDVRKAFNAYLTGSANAEQRSALRAASAGDFKGAGEVRAQGEATNGAGGFLVPTSFYDELIKRLAYYGPVRKVAKIISTADGRSMPFPRVDDVSNVASILTENTAATATDAVFTQATLSAYVYASLMLVSEQLATDAAFDMETLVLDLLSDRLGRKQNTDFTNGNGTTAPEGITTNVLTNSPKTAEATGNTNTITYNGIVQLVYALDPAYRQLGPAFQFHDNTLQKIRKLVDTQNRPLWVPAGSLGTIVPGTPDSLLGYPVYTNNDMTASLVANAVSGLFGVWNRAYGIRDVNIVPIRRLAERFADALQVGYLAVLRSDGKVLDPKAYAALQTSAT